MKPIYFILGVLLLAAGGAGWWLLQKPAEPPVNTKLYFGKALFGPDRSNPDAVRHFIVRGKDIFVDENKDNIPQPDELSVTKELPLIEDAEHKASYKVSGLRLGIAPESVSETLPQQIGLTVDVAGDQPYMQAGSIVLTESPEKSNWLHFHGPVQLFFFDSGLGVFKGAKKPTEVKLYVGSVSHGPSSKLGTNDWTDEDREKPIMSRTAFIIPDERSPFPDAKLTFITDGEPVVQELVMDKFC